MIKNSNFRPAWWLANRHLQTIWGAVAKNSSRFGGFKRHRLKLPDDDFIDIDVAQVPLGSLDQNKPTLLILHGLEGSSHSHYIGGLVQQTLASGMQALVMHFRGCSGEDNRQLSSYHSGISGDLQIVLIELAKRGLKIDCLVGFSLGGNVLLKWLGEKHQGHYVKAAVAVSVPLQLDISASAIDRGFSKLYSKRLLATLKQKAILKKQRYPRENLPSVKQIKRINGFWEFDNLITAPINGFNSAQDYYAKSSSRQFLKSIEVPTLIIHAKDDPFMTPAVIPAEAELSACVELELAERGGHVGFIAGRWPWRPNYYLEQRIPAFFAEQISLKSCQF
ncbi:hydrolase [Aliikangiella sp. IMCC44653]